MSSSRRVEVQAGPVFRLPDVADDIDQDEEFCEVLEAGEWRRIRFHDYEEIFSVPGLYERLFDEALHCESPNRVARLLDNVLDDNDQRTTDLRVLDLGAGNGMVGEELRRLGVQRLIGADIIPEARMAAERDRPSLYDDFVIEDFTSLSDETTATLRDMDLNCLVTVAALGFGDIPPRAFGTAFNLIARGGWVAFNVKEHFLSARDYTGFSKLIDEMNKRGIIHVYAYRRYRHRLDVNGEPIQYVAIIARKEKDVPDSLMADDIE
jgi:predicted TPR repeat methyltransferase